jgi:hypothetical protein
MFHLKHNVEDRFLTPLRAPRGGKCGSKITFEICKVETYHYIHKCNRETPMGTLSVNPVDRLNVQRENAQFSRCGSWGGRP